MAQREREGETETIARSALQSISTRSTFVSILAINTLVRMDAPPPYRSAMRGAGEHAPRQQALASGAGEHAQRPQVAAGPTHLGLWRRANDGNWYTEEMFKNHYGPRYHDMWNLAGKNTIAQQEVQASRDRLEHWCWSRLVGKLLEKNRLLESDERPQSQLESHAPQQGGAAEHSPQTNTTAPAHQEHEEHLPDHSTEAQQGAATEHSDETASQKQPRAHLAEHAAEAQKDGAAEHDTETSSVAAPPLTDPVAPAPENSLPTPNVQAGAAEHSLVPLLTMQCPACARTLCNANQLAFWRRHNVQGGFEVHLMLKPENEMPHTFVLAPQTEKGAIHTWNCECGTQLGNTRPVAEKKASITAFKSSAVVLGGHRYQSKKSKWPTVYKSPPFDQIEVRERTTYHG